MSVITIEVPEPIRARYLRLADARGITAENLLVEIFAAGIQALEDANYLERRAARAVPGAMRRLLDRVPLGEPEHEWDQLPPGRPTSRREILAMFDHPPAASPSSVDESPPGR